jgi:hypothetical protein
MEDFFNDATSRLSLEREAGIHQIKDEEGIQEDVNDVTSPRVGGPVCHLQRPWGRC